ncbi:hypothetical protein DYB28_015346 [Aphanomyces astaci]|uniref:Uncharacterized protein n=1 Tax=Aphanomyces astaci TaxID=112090 RepID=A0A397A845_APHAT|nr:hypothetical protein DYB36_007891 [Aphanomyces astaci]RHY36576.1 hypothetical protein DYB38_007404 [Aphanomyces astaci]RLO01663.1 hypothetical protein DYB28_015346 [Aphanomyces astaci]
MVSLLNSGFPLQSQADIKVYKLIRLIPAGKVATYGTVAKAIQSGPRGVADHSSGTHLPHKFLAIESSLLQEISMGSTDPKCNDLKDKRTLLTEEGVEFNDTKVDVSCMYVFTQDDLDQLEAKSP